VVHRTARLNVLAAPALVSRVELERLVRREGGGGPSRQPPDRPRVADPVPGSGLVRLRGSELSTAPIVRLMPPGMVEAILRARVERGWGPQRIGPLLRILASTAHAVLLVPDMAGCARRIGSAGFRSGTSAIIPGPSSRTT
jgi:hypothetical protein